MFSISLVGQTGLLGHKPGCDDMVQACSGFTGVVGEPGMPARFSDWPAPAGSEAGLTGGHNADVLAKPGLSEAGIARSYSDGVPVHDRLLDQRPAQAAR